MDFLCLSFKIKSFKLLLICPQQGGHLIDCFIHALFTLLIISQMFYLPVVITENLILKTV